MGRSSDFLVNLSSRRAKDGYTPRETGSFVFSLKQPIFSALKSELDAEPKKLSEEMLARHAPLDELGLLTAEAFQKSREEVITRQQQELLELSTPVVRLWENILALPLIGTLDSARRRW